MSEDKEATLKRKAIAKAYYKTHKEEIVRRQKAYDQIHKVEKKKSNMTRRQTVIGCLLGIFSDMKRRCNNPKAGNYKWYGGRGIKVCFKSANEFVDYVVNELCVDPRGLQIDRIDNEGNYESGNIRFVTAKMNCQNRG